MKFLVFTLVIIVVKLCLVQTQTHTVSFSSSQNVIPLMEGGNSVSVCAEVTPPLGRVVSVRLVSDKSVQFASGTVLDSSACL